MPNTISIIESREGRFTQKHPLSFFCMYKNGCHCETNYIWIEGAEHGGKGQNPRG